MSPGVTVVRSSSRSVRSSGHARTPPTPYVARRVRYHGSHSAQIPMAISAHCPLPTADHMVLYALCTVCTAGVLLALPRGVAPERLALLTGELRRQRKLMTPILTSALAELQAVFALLEAKGSAVEETVRCRVLVPSPLIPSLASLTPSHPFSSSSRTIDSRPIYSHPIPSPLSPHPFLPSLFGRCACSSAHALLP
jgi:hypothetical protein